MYIGIRSYSLFPTKTLCPGLVSSVQLASKNEQVRTRRDGWTKVGGEVLRTEENECGNCSNCQDLLVHFWCYITECSEDILQRIPENLSCRDRVCLCMSNIYFLVQLRHNKLSSTMELTCSKKRYQRSGF